MLFCHECGYLVNDAQAALAILRLACRSPALKHHNIHPPVVYSSFPYLPMTAYCVAVLVTINAVMNIPVMMM